MNTKFNFTIGFMMTFIVLLLNISFTTSGKAPRVKETKRVQYAICNDTLLLQEAYRLSQSDSIDSIVSRYISPLIVKNKRKKAFCGVSVKNRHYSNIKYDNIQMPYPDSLQYLLTDTATLRVYLLFDDDLHSYDYYTYCLGKPLFFRKYDLKSGFFSPINKFKTFSFYAKQPPKKDGSYNDFMDYFIPDISIYIFIYHNGRLYLEPSEIIWEAEHEWG